MKRWAMLALLLACGGAPKTGASDARGPTASPPAESAKPEAYVPKASPGDVVTRWVRTEQSSRLGLAMPSGKARAAFTAPIDGTMPRFLLAASNRIVVVGEKDIVFFDGRGRRIARVEVGDALFFLDATAARLGAVNTGGKARLYALEDGALLDEGSEGDYLDEPYAGETRVSIVRGAQGQVNVWKRGDQAPRVLVDGKFEPLAAAIDDDRIVHVVVRQGADLSLWSSPLAGGSIGRLKISSRPADRPRAPPILGAALRAIVLEDRVVAFARDGKVAFMRAGTLSGGATMTADDKLLVAHAGKVTATDAQGRTADVVVEPGVMFATPPILCGSSQLLVASAKALHAYTF